MTDDKNPRLAFEGATAKLTIGSLDNPSLTVRADYNPKELGLSKSLSWKDHNEGDKDVLNGKKQSKSKQDTVELTGVPKKTMSIELLFDGFEKGASVAKQIEILDELSSPSVPMARREDQRRPHFCVVVWGQRGIPAFRCVIDKIDVKYTMFDRQGTPLRATCTVSVTQAELKTAGSVDGAMTQIYSAGNYQDSDRKVTVVQGRFPDPLPERSPQPQPVTSRPTAGPSPGVGRPPPPDPSLLDDLE